MATRKVTPTKKTTKRKPQPKTRANSSKANAQSLSIDKVIDLIKWVDNPFKLLTVILLSTFAFTGYFAWDSRQVILHAIYSSNEMPKVKDQDKLIPLAKALMKDTDAVTVVVNSTNLATNSRTTILALSKDGREESLEGTNSSLFATSPERNKAVVSMLSGEVFCEDFVPSSKVGEWQIKHGAKYVCRGSIPPEMGKFAGYTAVGFAEAPKDLTAVKTRINFTNTQMAK
jgi:hypothetical protein